MPAPLPSMFAAPQRHADAREVIIADIEKWHSRPDRSPSAQPDLDRQTIRSTGDGPCEVLDDLGHVVTLRIDPPLRLAASVVMQQQVRALIARRPAGIVLEVAGLVPVDELGVLAFPALARDAARHGVALVLVDPSAALRERLSALGVRDLAFAYRSESIVTFENESSPSQVSRETTSAAPTPTTGAAATPESWSPAPPRSSSA